MNKNKNKFFTIDKDSLLLNQSDLIKKSYRISWIILGIDLLIIGLLWNSLPTKIPLWYSLPWGESRLANKALLSLLPIIGLLFSWFNLSLGYLLDKEDEFLNKIMAIVSVVESMWLTFIMFGIILVII